MKRFYDTAMLGIMAAALAVDLTAKPAPKPKDEQDLEAEAHRRAPMTETNAPEPNWIKRSIGLPHQGKREMARRRRRAK